MAKSNPVKEAVRDTFQTAGFIKKSNNWYLNETEVVQVVNIQKSNYGPSYYLNFAIALKSLGAIGFTEEHLCHVRFRLSAIIDDDQQSQADAALNLDDHSLDDNKRKKILSHLLESSVRPLFQKCSTTEGTIRAVESGIFKKAMVDKKIRQLISDTYLKQKN